MTCGCVLADNGIDSFHNTRVSQVTEDTEEVICLIQIGGREIIQRQFNKTHRNADSMLCSLCTFVTQNNTVGVLGNNHTQI